MSNPECGDQLQMRDWLNLPVLWKVPGRVLYIGAHPGRANGVDALLAHGHTVDLLEAFPENAAAFRAAGKPFAHVIEGDARDIDNLALPVDKYEIVIWLQGPEHIPVEQYPATLAALERRASRLVLLGSPWGRYEQGTIYATATCKQIPMNADQMKHVAADFLPDAATVPVGELFPDVASNQI